MGINNEQELRLNQLLFIGKILAGFTHEVKNYLAIINESVGLMGDMIKIGKLSQKDAPEYLEIIHSIEEQIEKTNVHFRYLNRFAHRMDTPVSYCNINESLEELIALMKRFANQRKIILEKDFREDIPQIDNNPSLLQFVVFSFIDEKIKKLDKNSKITVHTAVADNTLNIKIISEGNLIEGEIDNASTTSYEILEKIIRYLGGNILQEKEKETVIMLAIRA
jgi:signal transduction histidine kinase